MNRKKKRSLFQDILGLSGFLPLTPRCLQQARRKQIVASLRERVAAGETLKEEDIPIIVKYLRKG